MKNLLIVGAMGFVLLAAGGDWMNPKERVLRDDAYDVQPYNELADSRIRTENELADSRIRTENELADSRIRTENELADSRIRTYNELA